MSFVAHRQKAALIESLVPASAFGAKFYHVLNDLNVPKFAQ